MIDWRGSIELLNTKAIMQRLNPIAHARDLSIEIRLQLENTSEIYNKCSVGRLCDN